MHSPIDDKLARLKAALAKGEADLAEGRVVVISSDRDLSDFFGRLSGDLSERRLTKRWCRGQGER
jgi:hypothetical protein